MRIHYLSCHAVLEYDEIKLFTELGYDVFSNGAYADPKGHFSLPRPGIPGMKHDVELQTLAAQYPRTQLPPELIDPFDVIMVMHSPDLIIENWPRIKHKRVIWRTIGQSTPSVEARLAPMRAEGLQIVRYSPKESNIEGFIGSDAMIRFYKDPEEYKGWNGNNEKVVNFTQSLLGRRDFCHYDDLMSIASDLPFVIYGTGNEDLGRYNGGELPYDLMKGALRDNRVFLYGGTWPASYTLALIEAMMTGIPVVAIGKKLAHVEKFPQIDFYEAEDFIDNGTSGFFSNDHAQLHDYLLQLLKHKELAAKISENGRNKAIRLFGKENIAIQWKNFLGE